MGKPKAPKPADPKETATAQTGTNVATSIANTLGAQVDQITPDGTLTHDTVGYYTFRDPSTPGVTHKIPLRQATVTLSPAQQAQKDLLDRAEGNLAQLAADQSGRLNNVLSEPFNPDGLPTRPDASSINLPQLQQVGSGPNLSANIPTAPTLQGNIGDAGSIRDTYGTDFSADRQRVEDALFSRLDDRLEEDRASLEQRLADQGIRIGSEAYRNAMDTFQEGRNDARTSVVIRAGEEHTRLANLEAQRAGFENQAQQQRFNQGLTRASFEDDQAANQFGLQAASADQLNSALNQEFGNESAAIAQNNNVLNQDFANQQSLFSLENAARNQALQEEFAFRNQPINEVTALLSGSQVQNPQFQNVPFAPAPTTDFAGIQAEHDRAQLQAFQIEQAQRQSAFGGILGGIGSIFGGLSDRRTKDNIKKVGKTDDGQNIYSFTYKGDDTPRMGLMAQEVKKKKPEAVGELPGGLMYVDYDKALKPRRKGLQDAA